MNQAPAYPPRKFCPRCGAITPGIQIAEAHDMHWCGGCNFFFHPEGLVRHKEERPEEIVALEATTLSPGRVRAPIIKFVDTKFRTGIGLVGDEIILTDRFGEDLTRFENLGGIICADCGLVSKAAVYARAEGIPAVGGGPEVLEQFENGQIVEIDGNHGQILRVRDTHD